MADKFGTFTATIERLERENADIRQQLAAAQRERDGWRNDAKRYSANADYWKERGAAAESKLMAWDFHDCDSANAERLREARALLEESAVSIGGNWRDRRDKWLAAQADKARGGK